MLLSRILLRRALPRSLGTAAALAAVPILLQCGGSEPVPSRQSLADFCRFAPVEADRFAGAEAHEAAPGLWELSVPLSALEEPIVHPLQTTEVSGTMRQWALPFPAAADPLGTLPAPQVGDLERIHDASVQVDQPRGFFLEGDVLLAALPEGEELPADTDLSYPTYAGHLNGKPFAARYFRGKHSADSIGIPPGATLTARLTSHPGARLTAQVVSGDAGGASAPFRVFLDGTELSNGSARPDPQALSVPLGPLTGGAQLEIRHEGETGILWLEDAAIVRPRSDEDPPNAIFIVIDTLRADRVNASLTPALEGFRQRSLTFEQCWATSSWTLPSVATMLTSNHGGQHGAWTNDRALGPGLETLAERYRAEGYATAAFTGGTFVSQAYGLDRGFAEFDSEAGGVASVLARATEFLDRAEDGPWFLFIHTYEVHSPYEPPDSARERVVEEHGDLLGGDPAEPQIFNHRHRAEGSVPEPVAAMLSDLYDEGVRYADQRLGEFLGLLEERALLADTVLLLTSDHGEEFREHGFLGHGDSLYAEQLHVPLFIHLPGDARAGETVANPVSHLDLAPTLLDASGLWGDRGTFLGSSLLGGGASPLYATRQSLEAGLLQALRAGDRTFIQGSYYYATRRAEGDEAYDLSTDPREQVNLLEGEAFAGEGSDLKRRAEKLSKAYDERRFGAGPLVQDSRVLQQLRNLGYVDGASPADDGALQQGD